MNPFLVFDLDPGTTDEVVEGRYHELLREHPPDRNPETFAIVRNAYEALKNRRSRLKAWLFYFDNYGRSLAAHGPRLVGPSSRPRVKVTGLAAAIGSSHDDGEP